MHFKNKPNSPNTVENSLSLVVLTFLMTIQVLQGCPGFENYSAYHKFRYEKPQLQFDHAIGLSKFIQHDAHSNNTILINKTLSKFQLNCWAPFPIDFNFSGHVSSGLSKDEVTVRIFRKPFAADIDASNKRICYGINVSLTAYEETTGNYSCFAVGNIYRMQSYYIFVSPPPPGVLLKRGQNVIISLSPRATSVVFPCSVSNPDAHIKLIKEDSVEILLEENVLRFDPKVGFVMNLTNSKDHWSDYQCISPQSQHDFVNITLRKKDFFVTPKISNIRNMKKLALSCQSSEAVYFRYLTNNKDFSYSIYYIQNASTYLYDYVAKFESKEIKSPVSGWIACVKNETQKEIYRWTFEISGSNVTSQRPFTDTIKSACESTKNLTFCQGCNNWIECNINKCLSKDKSCLPTKCASFAQFPNAVIQCLNPNNPVSEIYFTGLNGTAKYTQVSKVPLHDVLRVNRVKVAPSNTLKFSCEGSSFVFAFGFHWFYSIKKESIRMDIPDSYKVHDVKQTWGATRATLKSLLELKSLPTNATKIYCSAPVWNSTKWEEVSVDITKKGNTKSSSNLIKASRGFEYVVCTGALLFFRSTFFKVLIN